METFAEYILNEENLSAKIEIVYYLAKKRKIFFDKSIVFKTELARLFLKYSQINVDENLILTACLLCNCKKIDNAQDLERIHSYAKSGAELLETMGFDSHFCKICEEINRYSGSIPRERESDILELIDQFGGMLLDRPERIGFKPDEAMVLLEHRNLKDQYNRYLETFRDFIEYIEKISMTEMVSMTAIGRLVKIYNETEDLARFIQKVVQDYEPKIDQLMQEKNREIKGEMLGENSNIPLFSEETTKKILSQLNENELKIKETNY